MASSVTSAKSNGLDRATTAPLWIRVATALLAAAIFVADTATPFEFSVSVLYVVVILMAGRFLRRRGTAFVAAACVILAVSSAILTPPKGEAFWGVANTLISIAAITITSFLVLQSQARELVLKEHIEERKRVEERVGQQEKELRAVLDFTPLLVAVFGTDRRRLYANQPSLAYIGLTLEQWQGITDPLWFFHPDDRERVAKGGYSGSGSEAPHEFEARFLRADGAYRWFLFRDNPLRDEDGRIMRWYLSAMDIEDRRRAEEELHNTAAELQRVMASVPDCLWSVEIDEQGSWKYSYYSPAVEKITGRPASFFLRDPDAWFSIVHADDKVRVATAAKRLANGEVELAQGEYRIVHANGDIRWIRDSGVATRLGERLRIDGVVSEISERKRAEDELLRSEAYLAETQRLTHTGSWAWVVKGEKPNYWSQEMYRIWDYDPANGVPPPETAWERIHPEDREKVREHMERALAYRLGEHGAADHRVVFADGVAKDVYSSFRSVENNSALVDTADFRIVLPNGIIKHIRFATRAVLNQAGELIEYVGTNIDVTAHVRAEGELRASEARFRTLVDHAADAILLRGDDGKLIDVNQYACELLGYTREELIGMTPRDLVDPNEDPAFFRSVDERLKAGELFAFESGLRRKDGTLLPVEVRVRPFSQDDQRLFLAIARDITERRQAEHERKRLHQLEAELAHINRVNVIGEMTASIAHEINQPLSGVVSNGEACLLWLAADSPNLEEAREAARRIVRDGTRAGEIISRIRGLVKKSPAPKTELDLNETVREVIALMADEAKRRKVTIQTEFAEALGPVVGDRVQLQQVVLNLVINAMDAMHDSVSRRLRIATSNIEPGQVCVTVQDTGVGLDSDSLTKIFDPFYSTKSGMGMGLSISRTIVQNHGGRLWATANEDAGATVQFTLPRFHDGASIA